MSANETDSKDPLELVVIATGAIREMFDDQEVSDVRKLAHLLDLKSFVEELIDTIEDREPRTPKED